MKRASGRKWTKALIVLILVYITGGVLLYAFQDKLLFHPRALPPEHQFSFDQPFEEVNLPYKENNLNIIKFRTREPRKGVVLFFSWEYEKCRTL